MLRCKKRTSSRISLCSTLDLVLYAGPDRPSIWVGGGCLFFLFFFGWGGGGAPRATHWVGVCHRPDLYFIVLNRRTAQLARQAGEEDSTKQRRKGQRRGEGRGRGEIWSSQWQ